MINDITYLGRLSFMETGLQNRLRPLIRLLLTVVAVAGAAFLVSKFQDGTLSFRALTTWLEAMGPWGPIYWILIVAAAVVLALPVPMIAAVSGFLFGAIAGPIYSLAGMEAGCTIAFLLGRFFLSGKASRIMDRNPKLRKFNRGLEGQGWTFILSTRLLPGFPVKLSNYAFGGLGYSLKDFMVGNLLGLAPYQIAGAFAGSLLSNISEPGSLKALAREPMNLGISLAGLAGAILLLVICVRRAVRSMEQPESRVE